MRGPPKTLGLVRVSQCNMQASFLAIFLPDRNVLINNSSLFRKLIITRFDETTTC